MEPVTPPPAMSADTFAALIILAIIGLAMVLFWGSKLYFWAARGGWRSYGSLGSVNSSASEHADYVSPPAAAPSPVPAFRQEPEPEREPEPGGTDYELPPLPAGRLYTDEQIATLRAQAEELGRAEALGLLLGVGLVDAEGRAQAMEALFGPRGRRHQRVRPLVDAAAARVAPPPEAARFVNVSDGRQVEI
jgi:hypothetical protein